MPIVSELIEHTFLVTTPLGAPVTGLTNGDFTKTLERLSGSSWVASAETVTVVEMTGASGWYKVSYTPAQVATYSLTVTHATYGTAPYRWEDEVSAQYGSSGPYLTTLAHVKERFRKTNATANDDVLNSLIARVSALFETFTNRKYAAASVSEYHDPVATPTYRLFLRRPPVSAISGLWVSTALPRVYGAEELLVEGEDYFVDADSGIVTFTGGISTGVPAPRAFRVDYDGGYSTIPPDLEDAAIETIATKFQKADSNIYHLTSSDIGDGAVGGIRYDDVPYTAREVLERYVLRRFVP